MRNDNSNSSGWVPAWVVAKESTLEGKSLPYPIMPALATFEGNSGNELSIRRAEWVEVIERHETGWTFGKVYLGNEKGKKKRMGNEEVTEEGWFPDWVIRPRNS